MLLMENEPQFTVQSSFKNSSWVELGSNYKTNLHL